MSALASKDGVGASSVWLGEGPWKTVLAFLQDRFPEIDAATWTARMERGDVVDERGARFASDCPYRSGVRLYYYREAREETPVPFEETVLYRDDRILVADKPHFLPVVPAGRFLQQTLLVRLKRKLQLDFLVPIHRIDRETAGIVMFSTEPESRGRYHALFERREIVKTYEAVAPVLPGASYPIRHRSRLVEGEPFFRMKEVEGEPNAETHIELLHTSGENGLYRLTPVTGKKHQLRVHMASLGMPIANDMFYPLLQPDDADDFSRPLQLLAKAIAFRDPITGASQRFESSRTLNVDTPNDRCVASR
ncbi:MAG TPA: RluA family pseudouridine synthase [Burkholderiales bacterium]|nr:RluA family pseudouridine synthase [Burkholderiales bacterium]